MRVIFMAGAIFGAIQLSFFVAGAVFGEIWNDSRSPKRFGSDGFILGSFSEQSQTGLVNCGVAVFSKILSYFGTSFFMAGALCGAM